MELKIVSPDAINDTRSEEIAPPKPHKLSDKDYKKVKELERARDALLVPDEDNEDEMRRLQVQIKELWDGR